MNASTEIDARIKGATIMFDIALRRASAAAFLFVTAATAAGADTIGSAPIFDTNQSVAACRIGNLGPDPVTIKSLKIFTASGKTIGIGNNNCGDILLAGGSCQALAKIKPGDSVQHMCRVITEGSAASLRGEFSLLTGTTALLASTPLR